MRTNRVGWMLAIAGVLMSSGAAHAQIGGVVRDSLTGRPLGASSILISSERDSTPLCSLLTKSDGTFSCPGLAPGSLLIAVHRVGFLPVEFEISGYAGDSLRLGIALLQAPAQLEAVRAVAAKDTSHHGLFWVTAGRDQFMRHMELGKGHFVMGADIKLSGMSLSQYLLTRFGDTLKVVVKAPGPSVPIANDKFLIASVRDNCLYVRVDRLGFPELMAVSHGEGDNIDDLLTLDEVRGVELYLNYLDVPAEWHMDTFASGVANLRRKSGTPYEVGPISGPPAPVSVRPGAVGSGQRVFVAGPPTGRGGGHAPPCPILQIWTRMAW